MLAAMPTQTRAHVGLDEQNRVVDRETRRHVSSGGVDVEVDVLVGVLGLEEQQLRHDHVRDGIVDRPHEKHDPFLEKARVDVVGPLAARRLLHHHGDEVQAPGPRTGSVRRKSCRSYGSFFRLTPETRGAGGTLDGSGGTRHGNGLDRGRGRRLATPFGMDCPLGKECRGSCSRRRFASLTRSSSSRQTPMVRPPPSSRASVASMA